MHLSKVSIRGVAVNMLKILCTTHLFLEYIGGPRMIAGPSMLPTMAVFGEVVIENNLSLKLRPNRLSRGDLVVLTSPRNPKQQICKRVLGLPGDIICVDPTGQYAPITEHVVIPKGHVWITGDNAKWSRDSREYGPVPVNLIRGKVIARVWPWKRRTIFRNPCTLIDV